MLAVGYQMYFLACVWIISVFFFLDSLNAWNVTNDFM